VGTFQNIARKLPINFKGIDLTLFEHELTRILPVSMKVILKYFLIDANGTFLTSKKLNVHIKEKSNFIRISLLIFITFLLKALFKGQIVFKKSLSVWFIDSWSLGYFHWMLDCLPRLHESGVKNDTEILLPAHFASLPFVIPSLEAMGFYNIKFMQANKYYLFNHLVFNTHSAPTGNYNEKTVRELREILTRQLKNDSINLGERIFVSREKAERRKIINETDLHSILKSFGFSIVYFEDYSWNEQVSICSNAKCLIGLHGAGLSNMLFMPADSVVLEFRKHGDSHNNCYFSLASALGHSYYYMQCNTNNYKVLNANFIVETDKFKELLLILFNTNPNLVK
jgi:hypothetical protein